MAHDHPHSPGDSHSHSHSRPHDDAPMRRGGLLAVLAAIAFGIVTPIVQRAGAHADAIPTACLLYAGAALATLGASATSGGTGEAPLTRAHAGRIVAVALAGAVFAPICFAWGLQRTGSTAAALLLNLEAVFTVLLAARLFHEPIGKRAALGLATMSAGGLCLVLNPSGVSSGSYLVTGSLVVALATFGWALDNVLTRPLADRNPTDVVRWKGALGATLTLGLSLLLGLRFPTVRSSLVLLACGATGYGLSLRLYLLAQRRIGAARTGSIFALAPFVGAVASMAIAGTTIGPLTILAAVLFALGVYLHIGETHHHRHTHDATDHEHAHTHGPDGTVTDGHHAHTHDPPFVGQHSHLHHHDPETHDHPHAPDVHHAHRHS